MRKLPIAALAASMLGLSAFAAQATTYSISTLIANNTAIEGYSNQTGLPASCGSCQSITPSSADWYGSIGTGFQTDQASSPYNQAPAKITENVNTSGVAGNSISFTFTSNFYSGAQVSGTNVSVYAADLFIQSNTKSSNPTAFAPNFAIALGLDSADGGNSSTGLYSLGSNALHNLGADEAPTAGNHPAYLTSQDVWDPKSGSWVYGGEFGTCTTTSCTGEASPTVLKANVAGSTTSTQDSLSDVMESVICEDSNSHVVACTSSLVATWTISLAALTGQGLTDLNSAFGGGFDFFWGTGDCSNGGIFGSDTWTTMGVNVPEPASLVVFGSALVGWSVTRRRRRATAAAA